MFITHLAVLYGIELVHSCNLEHYCVILVQQIKCHKVQLSML